MLKKSFIILKSNPMIIVLFILAIILLAVPAMLVLPDMNRLMAISGEISGNSTSSSGIVMPEITEMLFSILMLLLYSLAACGFGIVFMAGFGNMIAAAVNGGKASMKIFRFGIKKFFTKTLLSFLLLVAVIYGFSLIISIISVPFTIMGVMNNAFDPGTLVGNQKIISVVSSGIMIFMYPLVLLWLPSIFLDRNEGVIACFKKGFKAGLKKYILLVAVTAVILLPTILLFIFTENLYSIMESPLYILMYVYQAIILPFLLTYLFVIYNEMREIQLDLKTTGI